MIAWWESLTVIQQIFAVIAIPATVILFLQTILLLFGVGGHGDNEADMSDTSGIGDSGMDSTPEMEADVSGDHDAGLSGLRIFTVRGLVAFCAVGGWLGVAVNGAGLGATLSILCAVVGGSLALVLVALFLKWAVSLQETGNISIDRAVGRNCEVYLRVPRSRSGKGKVSIMVSEQLLELDAVTDSDRDISPRETVVVLAVEGTTLVVSPIVK